VSWILDVPRSVLLLEDQEEPWVHLTLWSASGVQSSREPALSLDAVVDRALVEASFFCADAGAPVNHVVYRSLHGLQRWRGALLNPALRSRLEMNRLLSCRLTSTSVRGRVFFVDGARPSLDELLFAEVITDMLSIRLDRYYLARRLRERAVSDERGRFSRDLHDGLLQSLTAWGLQIGEVARRLQDVDAAVAHRLHDIRRQMAGDQRELRSFIGRLQSDGTAEPVDFSLIGRLHDLRDRFADEWGLTVEVDFSGLHALIPPALRAEVCRIVHEALANAARHARTSLVRVKVAATDDDVFLSVEDRGCGFPFKGRYDLATLRAERQGPTSVIDRVADIGGELVLESSDSGSRLDIVIPCNAVRPARAEDAS
jgi:signal transduction histidine kinase